MLRLLRHPLISLLNFETYCSGAKQSGLREDGAGVMVALPRQSQVIVIVEFFGISIGVRGLAGRR